MQTTSILLLERSDADLDQTSACVSQIPYLQIIGRCTNAQQAYAMWQIHHPDVILCELFLGGLDSLKLMHRMPHTASRPMILATSSMTSDCVLANASDFGADFFIPKPFTAEQLKETLQLLLAHRPQQSPPEHAAATVPQIHRLLIDEGFTSRYQGFHYLATALALLLENPNRMASLTKILYGLIADRHQTLPTRVERDIRHAIHGVCERSGLPPFSNGTMLRHLLRRYHQKHGESLSRMR